jgi:hypothetical protein
MPYSKHPNAEKRRKSAIVAIKAILSPDLDLDPKHRYEFLGLALGKLTEAEGTSKYKTRFQSEQARAQRKNLRHDHVFRKKMMIESMIQNRDEVDRIAARAVGCTITKEEHGDLDKIDREFAIDGWDRYARAGIVVLDMETGQQADLTMLAAAPINL